MAEISCRHFNGYKPCGLSEDCSAQCAHYSKVSDRILIVHLEALGAVLRSTALLPAIKRKFPKAHITWITKAPAQHLLENIKEVDRIFTTSSEDLMKLKALRFDVVYCIDKSLLATSIAGTVTTSEYFGFKADPYSGAILPANSEANELWQLGLDNKKKFFENKKSELQLVHESLCLGEFKRDEYQVNLTEDEKRLAKSRRWQWSQGKKAVIGINTGCSSVIPYKKMTVENHKELIRKIKTHSFLKNQEIVLLGGTEDAERNYEIARATGVIESPTNKGLRDGLCSVAACDVVISGDSLGLHMAIGLKKWNVAWFGPTCPQEIELYGRGVKIQAEVPCTPCWKRVCHNQVMCYDRVDLTAVLEGVTKGFKWLNLSFKQHSPEISF